jgi:NADH-quinone oxidoreductase subunit C
MLSEQVLGMRAAQSLESAVPGAALEGRHDCGELTLEIAPERIVDACRHLKSDGYVRLAAVTCVDRYPMEPRFEVVYHLHSISRNERLRLKCRVPGDRAEIDSVYGVWRGADWYEREVFDMFGVFFRNHPNMTRILMPDDWEGHPLRKDYPVHGHKYSYPTE